MTYTPRESDYHSPDEHAALFHSHRREEAPDVDSDNDDLRDSWAETLRRCDRGYMQVNPVEPQTMQNG